MGDPVAAVTVDENTNLGSGKGACPYTSSPDWAATGLGRSGVSPGPVAYRFDPGSDALDALAAVRELWRQCKVTYELSCIADAATVLFR